MALFHILLTAILAAIAVAQTATTTLQATGNADTAELFERLSVRLETRDVTPGDATCQTSCGTFASTSSSSCRSLTFASNSYCDLHSPVLGPNVLYPTVLRRRSQHLPLVHSPSAKRSNLDGLWHQRTWPTMRSHRCSRSGHWAELDDCLADA